MGAREQQQRSIVSFLGTKRPLPGPPRNGLLDGSPASVGTAEGEEAAAAAEAAASAARGGAASDSKKADEPL